MAKISKKEFVARIAARTGFKKVDAEKFVNAFLAEVKDALANGDSVNFVGFGSFSVAHRAERVGRNPQTGEEIKIPATKVPKFKPGKELREVVK